MIKLMITARKFFEGEEGATTIEYGLMLALIAAATVASFHLLGGAHSTKLGTVNTAMAR